MSGLRLRRAARTTDWRQRRAERQARLIPISVALAGTIVLAGAVAGGLIRLILSALGPVDLAAIKPSTGEVLEIVKISLAVVAGIGGVVALVVAYRKQRVTEAGENREQAKLYAERFDKASDKLGNDAAAVRLAGVHALAALADDWAGGRQMCIDVLCAYLRMPATPEPAVDDLPSHTAWRSMVEVHATILRLITTHMKADAPIPWHGADLDFTGVVFTADVNFAHAVFSGGKVSFEGAEFSGGKVSFGGAVFSGGKVSFGGAEFTGGKVSFDGAKFSSGEVSFSSVKLSGGNVSFDGAKFFGSEVLFSSVELSGGEVSFGGAVFSGGRVSFGGAVFSGGRVSFGGAKFTGGKVSFGRAKFTGSKVSFGGAVFSGGEVWFGGGRFSAGEVWFGGAKFFGGEVWFGGAKFSGSKVSFHRVGFSGAQVSFGGAEFSGGEVWFSDAEFSRGKVSFGDAKFSGGTVDFSRAAKRHPAVEGLPERAPGLHRPTLPVLDPEEAPESEAGGGMAGHRTGS
ncbi:pentapeptide repeat-containing protein [Nonomuraea sp. NN258]|uniref:pentapeptide repeat-containing protein n=1 Tax=Nonomuraea antri TaxID=2730852 RepID=UPI0015693050|nr:pentapeptide repeat-containing protein [Nonomuraea antri]NRQ32438.1 pentapeptide repeat-containing protein [Nonomuraea antri]